MRGGPGHSSVHVLVMCHRPSPLSSVSLSRASPCGLRLHSRHHLHPLRLPGGRAGAGRDHRREQQGERNITSFRGGSGLKEPAPERIGGLRPLGKKHDGAYFLLSFHKITTSCQAS